MSKECIHFFGPLCIHCPQCNTGYTAGHVTQKQKENIFMWLFLSTVGNIYVISYFIQVNPLNAQFNPTCYLPPLLGAHHFLHVSGLRVNVKPDSEAICGRRPWSVLKHSPVFTRKYGESLRLGFAVPVLGTSQHKVIKSSSVCEQRRGIAVPTLDGLVVCVVPKTRNATAVKIVLNCTYEDVRKIPGLFPITASNTALWHKT